MTGAKPAGPAGSAWAPLRVTVFRSLWLALLASNIGTWMQLVGAQWLLIDEPNASTLVAVVQTALMLPALLLSLPAGAVLRPALPAASALGGVSVNAARAIGPAVAGLLIAAEEAAHALVEGEPQVTHLLPTDPDS